MLIKTIMGRHTSSQCVNTRVAGGGATPLPLAVLPLLCIWPVVVAPAPLAVAPSPVVVFPLHTEPLHKLQTFRQHPETKGEKNEKPVECFGGLCDRLGLFCCYLSPCLDAV